MDATMMRHLQRAWNRAAMEGIDRYLAVDRERRIIETVFRTDPTAGKYAEWLAGWRRRTWEEQGLAAAISLSELRKIAATLSQFANNLPYLAPAQRDIGCCRTLDDVLAASESLSYHARARQRRTDRRQADEETFVLFEDDLWRILHLRGPAAARHWGKDTRWCTARTEADFERYRLKGDLIVLITPVGRYQLAVPDMEFRDAADKAADLRAVLSDAPANVTQVVEAFVQASRYRT